MNQPPVVSICMLTYNHRSFIAQAIEGVLMQKCNFKIELIIADDCSPDDTESIISGILRTDSRANIISYTKHAENKGMNENSLWALSQCRGKYIALCEGDDYWIDPLKLQKQVDFLDNNPDYGIVHTNYTVKNSVSGTNVISNKFHIDRMSLEDYLLGKFHIATLTVCFRRELLGQIDMTFLKENFQMGDHPLWLEMMRLSHVNYLPDVTATYNLLGESASHSKNLKKQFLFHKNIYEVRLYFTNKYYLDHITPRLLRYIYYYDSLLLIIDNKRFDSCLFFAKSHLFKKKFIVQYIKMFFNVQ